MKQLSFVLLISLLFAGVAWSQAPVNKTGTPASARPANQPVSQPGFPPAFKPAADPGFQVRLQGVTREQIAGPSRPGAAERERWIDTLRRWRKFEKDSLHYSGALYSNPKLNWTKKIFTYAQMMVHDRYFYDPVTLKYTVNRYLDDLDKRYGGLDAVLIWQSYPNIGIDDRNQFDLLADLPGGKKGVRQMIHDFHARGVNVFFPIMIWDKGTRKIDKPMPEALVRELKELGADGLNGDTMEGVTEDFQQAAAGNNYPLALEPEMNIHDLHLLEWNTMSWGYFWKQWGEKKFTDEPGVSLYKWMEPRHQVNLTDRWVTNRNEDLQAAFFNGAGVNTWENVWGIWNQVNARDALIIRRMHALYKLLPQVWSSPSWEPYITTLQPRVFASAFPGTSSDQGMTLYTLINRDSTGKTGPQLNLEVKSGSRYFDLWNGKELTGKVTAIDVSLKSRNTKTGTPVNVEKASASQLTLDFTIDRNGFGAVLQIEPAAWKLHSKAITACLNTVSKIRIPVNIPDWKPMSQVMVSSTGIRRKLSASKDNSSSNSSHYSSSASSFLESGSKQSGSALHGGMIYISGTEQYAFESTGLMIEGDELPAAVGIQYPWEQHPSRNHKKELKVNSFYLDLEPVSNREFKRFLSLSHYKPRDTHNFLKDWIRGGYPKGQADKAVNWVSLEDARAYAAWAGKRLPHDWEWQYAAQSPALNAVTGTALNATENTALNTAQASAMNAVKDTARLVGMGETIWQWTDEYQDEHTRYAVLKGGSRYRAQGSPWYFPSVRKLSDYGKYLLMSPGLDRSANIGFRCAAI